MNHSRSLLVLVLAAIVGVLLPAGPVSAGQTVGASTPDQLAASAESALEDKSYGPQESGASTSRRQRPKYMPMYKAKNNARYAAYQIYLDPEFNFDRYGTGKCHRLSRSSVYCYTWASEDVYDDLGYYFDTILCDWFTTSSYGGLGRMRIRIEQPECVLLSEV
ncbi:MAG: hypothetical protein QG596_1901 [Actinomycetota bacterium]|nr:hypothetical protein [Actinomycetota bacterium]